MSGIGTTLYNTLFKRTSTFALTVIVGSFFFERAFDLATDTIFDSINQGIVFKYIWFISFEHESIGYTILLASIVLESKQWKDIKHKYETE